MSGGASWDPWVLMYRSGGKSCRSRAHARGPTLAPAGGIRRPHEVRIRKARFGGKAHPRNQNLGANGVSHARIDGRVEKRMTGRNFLPTGNHLTLPPIKPLSLSPTPELWQDTFLKQSY